MTKERSILSHSLGYCLSLQGREQQELETALILSLKHREKSTRSFFLALFSWISPLFRSSETLPMEWCHPQ